MHKNQESGMMWSFKEQRYVSADEYWDIDGDCRLTLDEQIMSKLASMNDEVQTMHNISSCPGDFWGEI